MENILENPGLVRGLLAASDQGVWAVELVEGEAPRMYGDAAMMRLLGVAGRPLSPEQVYRAWYDNIHPEHVGEVNRSVAEMVAGIRSEVQYPWRHPELGEIWIRCWGVRDSAYGRGVRLEGLHRDVTELHHVQKRADDLAAWWGLLEKFPEMVFVKDGDDGMRYVYCNESFRLYYGRNPVGLADEEAGSNRDLRLGSRTEDEAILRDGRRRESEAYSRGPDGKIHFYRLVKVPFAFVDSRRLIIGMVDDLTDMQLAHLRTRCYLSIQESVRTSGTTRQFLERMGRTVLENIPYLKGVAFCPARRFSRTVCFLSDGLGAMRTRSGDLLSRSLAREMDVLSLARGEVRQRAGLDEVFAEARELGVRTCYALRIDGDRGVGGHLLCLMDSAADLSAHRRTFAALLRETLASALSQWQSHLRLCQAERRSRNMERRRGVNAQRINAYLSILLRESDMEAAIAHVLQLACEAVEAPMGALVSFNADGVDHGFMCRYSAPGLSFGPLTCITSGRLCRLTSPAMFPESGLVRIPDMAAFLSREDMGELPDACRRDLGRIGSLYMHAVHFENRLWGGVVVAFQRPRILSAADEEFLSACANCVRLMLFRKTSQDRTYELVEKAKAAEKAKSLFLASVSHDLRTPLNSILGFSELLRSERDEDRRRDYLDTVAYSGGILLDLINDVLDLARLDARKMSFASQPTDVGREIGKTLDMMRSKAEEKGLALVSQVPAMPRILLDEHRFRQIVFNLVGNAIKFTDSGEVSVSAELGRKAAGDAEFRLRVADTGIGIAASCLEKIMEPYVRIQSAEKDRSGAGLGLSICRRIVEHAGGRIDVTSELGKGSVFTVVLPHVTVCDASEGVAAGTESPTPAPDHSHLRILIVDDIEVNRTMLALFCRRLGAGDCTEVPSAAQAIGLMRRRPFDLVLTDKKMPGMDGEDFIREVRADPVLARTRICLVTADVEARESYRRVGADGVLLKPVVMDRLREVLSACVPARAGNVVHSSAHEA